MPVNTDLIMDGYMLDDIDINAGLTMISKQWPSVITQACLVGQRPQCFQRAIDKHNNGDFC